MAEPAPEPIWVYAATAARICGRCRKTIMRWIDQGKIDVEVQLGPREHRYLVRVDQVRAMRESRLASSRIARST